MSTREAVSPTLGERLATVETEVKTIKESQHSEDQRLESIEKTLAEFRETLERYKGFVGGIILVFSCIGACIKALPIISGFFTK